VLPRSRDLRRDNFRKVYLEVMAARSGERVATLMEDIAKRVGISSSTAYEWAKEMRGAKS
jgi:transposase